ncbi:DUF7691 family protein [Microscilla marina]|uniref:DUF7691 domain-containing protein n=1 Tax=Microscilla marina ATCC 23134 TaxID=313606 RepID=A1ZKW9_MICM2|nr:hypothetical protein [Microscilla marina]EAY28935.1 hypothetical protein M23134_00089 [Microscilla marina ATCC 23134]
MSYHVAAYLVSGQRLEALTKGKSQLAEVWKDVEAGEHTKRFAQSLDEGFADDFKDGCPDTYRALLTLMQGKAQEATEWEYMYGYALQLLCETYGQALTNDGFTELTSVEYLLDLEVFSAKVLNFRVYDDFFAMPPALPLPLSEYPMVGFLPLSRAKPLAKGFVELNLEHPEFGEGLSTLQSWVDHMLTEKKDLITFFY